MSFKNKKIAFVFPGQGAQYIGMGMDLIENFPNNIKIFNEFKKKTGEDLLQIMKDGPEDKLKETRFTQPAILGHSIMALNAFLEKLDIIPDYCAGHSLGEFTALVANQSLKFSDALYLVHKRGEFMIKANDGTPFAMAAILGLAPEVVKDICEEASKQHLVVAANFNTPVQTVISGTKEGVELASSLAKEKKAKRVMPLVVGGAFHSPLVSKASIWLKDEMDMITFNDSLYPVIANVDAKPVTKVSQIKDNLVQQVTSSVLWVDTIKYLESQQVEIYIEFGPQKVLSGMIKKIQTSATIFNIDKYDDIENVVSEMEQL
jgi:[acyl-carrier-protein] S-malonyltransferase